MGQSTPLRSKILVVEDEPLIRMLACDMLADAGFEPFGAVDADDALRILHGEAGIRAVFTDINMPGVMDGVALAAAVHAEWPDTLIVVTSGKLQPGIKTLPEGTLFLSKPYDRRELLASLEPARPNPH